ncbi:MAG: hypothetical protein V3U03_11330 [Myxococcota bacterium]
MRPCLALAAALGALLVAVGATPPAARASAPAPAGTLSRAVAPARAAHPAAEWRGRYCTSTRCAGTRPSPWGQAAGFGAAVLAAGWIGRRRHARR